MKNQKKIAQALTAGLLAGYGGQSKFSTVNRASFELKSSHFENKDIVYHDEWTNGGGQEIVGVDGDLFTRVYAGGVVDPEILQKLNITHQDVIANLISRIQQLGDKTRLFDDCQTGNLNGWGYEYKMLDHGNQIPVTTGKEIIKYHGQTVFIHVFILSPIDQR